MRSVSSTPLSPKQSGPERSGARLPSVLTLLAPVGRRPPEGRSVGKVARIVKLPGGNRVDVVGESFYRKAIQQAVHLVGEGEEMLASLVPDPANPYDPNAVKVIVAGKHVGHLSRDVAVIFGPVARRITELGCDAQCTAMITGGGQAYGVVLDLGTPDACLECLID